MKHFFIFFAFLFFITPLSGTVQVLTANGGTFSQPVTAKAYDRATGNFYIGLAAGGGTNAVSVAGRPDYGSSSVFVPLAQNNLNGHGIRFLTLATSIGNLTPILGVVVQPASSSIADNAMNALSTDGKTLMPSQPLRDATGALGQNGAITSGIVGLAANKSFMFPAVRPCNGAFGANCNGGIASVAINQSTLALTQVPANAADGGVKAQTLDSTTPAVYIDQSPTITADKVDLYWDDQLQRLYIGLQVTSAGMNTPGITCATGSGICVTSISQTCGSGLIYDPGVFSASLAHRAAFIILMIQCASSAHQASYLMLLLAYAKQ